MFYIVYNCITPNTASGNRFMSFLKGFDELGIDCLAVLLNPSCDHYKISENYKHVKIRYYWKDWPFARKVMDRFYRPVGMKRFLSTLRGCDVVFCYGSPSIVTKLITVKGAKVFHERTENPEVLPLSDIKEQKRYLEACKSLDGLFVISSSLKRYFTGLGVPAERIRIINMMVDSQRFSNLNKTTKVEKYIAYCGTASNNKDGVDELIKSFYLVCTRHNDVKLYIIGAAPSEDDEAGNLKLVESLGIKDKVVFTGIIEAGKMPQLLKDATILALDRPDSLQAQNGFPTKLGEYLMTENPVVVTKVGDIPLFLKDGENALLAEQRNPEEFAEKLCWVLEHSKEAAEIGQRGKEVALRDFNYLNESKKIIDFIYGNNTCSR